MEVGTGDIKAIVNLEKCEDGSFREIQSHAVSDLLEPGSVFKTASVMTALEDGVCDTTFRIPTGNGIWHIYGRDMKDSHWRTGGYGTISLGRAMEVSSNIGVSYVIDKFYHNDPVKFVAGHLPDGYRWHSREDSYRGSCHTRHPLAQEEQTGRMAQLEQHGAAMDEHRL